MAWWAAVKNTLFGSDKGLVEQISDVADKWSPSETTKHKMSLEDQTAGDASQESARAMVFTSHNSWFDILVDGLNRLPRPVIAFWAIGVLTGWIDQPTHLAHLDPLVGNIIWTVATFFFGSRVIFKDIPAMVKSIKKK